MEFGSQFECPDRSALLKRLKGLIGDVKPLIWASLWLSDFDCLRKLVTEAEENPDKTRFLLDGIALGHDFIVNCGL
jgi:hypothetical protein